MALGVGQEKFKKTEAGDMFSLLFLQLFFYTGFPGHIMRNYVNMPPLTLWQKSFPLRFCQGGKRTPKQPKPKRYELSSKI